ncbi:MAG: VOC family protein [Phycisphaeraceae bacterium]|nr:VOC family protein [Phycisphaeraceae bacterium]MCB9847193.1 VOC family protein [Phycisphaeraceae bacterium]
MNIRRVVPDITTDRIEATRDFYTDLFGFNIAMDMGWYVCLASPSNPTAQIQLIRGDAAANANGAISIEVADPDAIHATATAAGAEIVYPLTNEPWGVRRFFVKDPNGVTINVMRHIE